MLDDFVPLDATDEDDIIEDAQLRFRACADREQQLRDNFLDDIKIAEGDSRNNAQWPADIVTSRQTDFRPCLTNNLIRVHCLQVLNDARQNKPGIEIRPTADKATYEAAKVLEGIVRHIEYASDAQATYDSASYFQIYGGFGYWRVVTEYADETSFDQDIRIKRVPNPLAVYLDPDIQEFDGSDAKFGFVFTDMERRTFAKAHPGLLDEVGSASFETSHGWVTTTHVRVADYYRRVDKKDWLTAMPDGTTVLDSDLSAELRDAAKASGLPRRKVTRQVVQQFKIAGMKIIERTIWPGKYIPIVRVIGEETEIDGQLDRKGHTRSMISAQQMNNYFYSAAVEHVALQGKTPWVGPMEAFEGYETYWSTANTVNHAWLPYKSKDDTGQPIDRPERPQPPTMAQAFIQGLTISSQLIMDVSGQHQANLGEPSNEKSGVAIQQRQRQGDNATYHYVDHLAQAIRFTGRILIDLIPKVYDTKRVTAILGEDGSQQMVQIDPDHPAPHTQVQDPDAKDYDPASIAAIFNPNVGKYSVVADIGPSYATKRQDAFNAFSQIMQNNQEAMKIAGDLMWQNADFPGADELAERFRRAVPQGLLTDGPPPELVQAQQQMAALKQEAEHRIVMLQQQLNDATQKLKDRNADIERQDYEAETRRLATVATVDPEAIKPIIRQLVSEVLQTPIVPVMAMHAAAEQAMQPPPMPADGAQPASPQQSPPGGP